MSAATVATAAAADNATAAAAAAAAAPAAAPPAPLAPAVGSVAWASSLKPHSAGELQSLSPGVRAFYAAQNEMIAFYVAAAGSDAGRLAEARAAAALAQGGGAVVAVALGAARAPRVEDAHVLTAEEARVARLVACAINASFSANIVLLALKVWVSVYSGSLAVIASTVDTVMDLVSGSIVWVTARLAARAQLDKFPVGKSRYEPLSLILFSCLMGAASLQLITQGIVELTNGAPADTKDGGALTYGVLGAIIFTKALLWLFCASVKRYSTSVCALALDHWADVLTNTAPLVAVLVVARWPVAWALDPGAAIAMAVYMLYLWGAAGVAQAALLTGKAATPRELAEITYLALTHDPAVLAVDTVLAYSQGNKLLAEVDIVLPRTMQLWESHDVGESLQFKIERLVNVERCFVHADHEVEHHRNDEHWHPSHQPAYAPPE